MVAKDQIGQQVERWNDDKIQTEMTKLEQKGASDCKIKDELQSYNILHNEKYIRLIDLKYVLEKARDSVKKAKKAQQAKLV